MPGDLWASLGNSSVITVYKTMEIFKDGVVQGAPRCAEDAHIAMIIIQYMLPIFVAKNFNRIIDIDMDHTEDCV